VPVKVQLDGASWFADHSGSRKVLRRSAYVRNAVGPLSRKPIPGSSNFAFGVSWLP